MTEKAQKYFESLFPDADISVSKIENGLVVRVSQMYEFVNLTFAILKQISEHYGTDEIDVDDYARSGCDTCDYGSSYTHTVTIEKITKNLD